VNRGPDPAPIHVLPHLWYRNTWSWCHGSHRHTIDVATSSAARTHHPELGETLVVRPAEDGAEPALLFTENDTNVERLFGDANPTPYVKDGINDAVVLGRPNCVNGDRGSKVAAQCRAMVRPGESFTVQTRLFIAAHARALGVTLVTTNTAEFERVRDPRLENWTLPHRRH
jgi:hypothetical protein